MYKRLLFILALILATAVVAVGQNTNSSATRPSRATATPTPAPARDQLPTPAPPPTSQQTTAGARAASRTTPTETAVRAAFDTLVDGIRRADVETVMGVYWNSPQLVLFNNNGTVTKAWQQVRANRQSSYPNLRDVKLDVRDVRVHVLSPTSAVVTSLWSQTQTVRDQPETATGRMTLVFQKLGGDWKIVHTHTSPDRPDPSLIPPSEREPAPPAGEPTEPASKPPVKP